MSKTESRFFEKSEKTEDRARSTLSLPLETIVRHRQRKE